MSEATVLVIFTLLATIKSDTSSETWMSILWSIVAIVCAVLFFVETLA